MNIQTPLPLLGGLTPEVFMRRHWHKKPLVIRQAIPGFSAILSRGELIDLAGSPDVESRLIVQGSSDGARPWSMRHGPISRRAIPAFRQSGWTLLVQGVDLHDERLRQLREQFSFIPDARLDDVMISYASDGGGVGPHFDSYDVFLLQAHGRRKWRIGRQKDLRLQPDMPLKILANFEPEQEFVLEPGDMLYLPPRYAHDGIAQGECMTYSIGFRAPRAAEFARDVLQRLSDLDLQNERNLIYRDPRQPAVTESARIPPELVDFGRASVARLIEAAGAIERAVGEGLTEPKASVWFESGAPYVEGDVHLDRQTRMMFDADHIFINGESFRAGGKDARLMQKLANSRQLTAAEIAQLSVPARDLLSDWCEAGWLVGVFPWSAF